MEKVREMIVGRLGKSLGEGLGWMREEGWIWEQGNIYLK